MNLRQIIGLIAASATLVSLGLQTQAEPQRRQSETQLRRRRQIAQTSHQAQNIDLEPAVVGYAVTAGSQGRKTRSDTRRSAEGDPKSAGRGPAEVGRRTAPRTRKTATSSSQRTKRKKGREGHGLGSAVRSAERRKGQKADAQGQSDRALNGHADQRRKIRFVARPRSTAEFPLQGIIKGWQESPATLMPEGSVYRLYIPPELAYGRRLSRRSRDVGVGLQKSS